MVFPLNRKAAFNKLRSDYTTFDSVMLDDDDKAVGDLGLAIAAAKKYGTLPALVIVGEGEKVILVTKLSEDTDQILAEVLKHI